MLYANIYEYIFQYLDLKTIIQYVRLNREVSRICEKRLEQLKLKYRILVEEKHGYYNNLRYYRLPNGWRHGEYQEFNHDRTILLKHYVYIDNKIEGVYQALDNQGTLIEKCIYVSGEIHGQYNSWHRGGKTLKKQCNYIYGKRYGLYQKWDYGGNLKETCNYNDGKIEGVHQTWTKYTFKEPTKTECRYVNGKKNGISRWWNKNNQLIKRCIFINNKLNGLYQTWQYSDTKELIRKEEFMCKNGQIDGLYQRWFYNGYNEKLEILANYMDGKKEGQYKEWSRKGHLILLQHYLNDQINGINKVGDKHGILYPNKYYYQPRGPKQTVDVYGKVITTQLLYDRLE